MNQANIDCLFISSSLSSIAVFKGLNFFEAILGFLPFGCKFKITFKI